MPECSTLVIFGRVCDACLARTAVELARRFQSEMVRSGFAPGSDDLRAALAGTGGARPVFWYEKETPLGPLPFRDAVALREQTETACFLLGFGGEPALAHLPGHHDFRAALASYCSTKAAPEPAVVPQLAAGEAEPEPGVLADMAAADEAWLARPLPRSARSPRQHFGRTGAERMAGLYGSLPRIQTTVLANPEERFDVYAFAVLVLIAIFLLHR